MEAILRRSSIAQSWGSVLITERELHEGPLPQITAQEFIPFRVEVVRTPSNDLFLAGLLSAPHREVATTQCYSYL